MAETLSPDEVEERIPPEWDHEDGTIRRTYEFDEYLRGVAFAQLVGEIAEAQFHHPTIVIRYGEVEISLTTHEADGLTEEDIEMAQLIESESAD